jgi:hypothetical protein
MNHFTYKHLPAGGLGFRDPVRPYVTGGLGLAFRIIKAASILRMRYSKRELGPTYSEVEGVRQ